MEDVGAVKIKRPIALRNRSFNVDGKGFLQGILKTGLSFLTRDYQATGEGVMETVGSLGLAKEPGEVAWLLLARSLESAVNDLLKENQELMYQGQGTAQDQVYTVSLAEKLDSALQKLEESNFQLDDNFFRRPEATPVLKMAKEPLVEWLGQFGIVPARAESMADRLPTYFAVALNDEWSNSTDKYAVLVDQVKTPFTTAVVRQRGWLRYEAFLKKQVDEPVFGESFGLRQVYVPLQAFYYMPLEKSDKANRYDERAAKPKKEVVDPVAELEAWLKRDNSEDAIRVISGGPGSGKSSFVKMFAAKLAARDDLKVLFIPLHRFETKGDLIDAVGEFVRVENMLMNNPLDLADPDPHLLLIFDGLDELQAEGKIGQEVARQFVDEVQRKVNNLNSSPGRKLDIKVLISGRELIVQESENLFRKEKQILHLLPYFVEAVKKNEYEDPSNLLKADQRQIWWNKYGTATGIDYAGMPDELAIDSLNEITAQPLLNYLVALAHARNALALNEENSLNTVYASLLSEVYERRWGPGGNRAAQPISQDQFVRLLEEVGLAAWHGNGRTTTLGEIESYCKNSGLEQFLQELEASAEAGISRLLLAFYFRQGGTRPSGDKTFEFTHKSFGEYLTSRRIVRELEDIHDELELRKKKPGRGSDERECLRRWAVLCGSTAMDQYLLKFVIDEVRLQDKEQVAVWQKTLCRLIDSLLIDGMPMEQLLSTTGTFHKMNLQARNAEESLLAALSACARVTKEISDIDWPSEAAAGVWLARLDGQRQNASDSICWQCLGYLNLSQQILTLKNLIQADLSNANLSNANLSNASLSNANLSNANLSNANLREAILPIANLREANLSIANLRGAYLIGAYLIGADLEGANLEGADLEGANLEGADLEGANLEGANLEGANLEGANLEGADLRGAKISDSTQIDPKWRLVHDLVNGVGSGRDLREANLSLSNLSLSNLSLSNLSLSNLEGANFSGAYLNSAELSGADLRRADLSEANLSNANLKGANLRGATIFDSTQIDPKWKLVYELQNGSGFGRNLSRADLSGADLQSTNLEGANLEGANLEGANLEDADLIRANLTGADLTGAVLSRANVTGTLFGSGIGLSEGVKANLKSRGAKFDDSLGDRDPVESPIRR